MTMPDLYNRHGFGAEGTPVDLRPPVPGQTPGTVEPDDARPQPLDLRPDPLLSTLRPGWAREDTWRELHHGDAMWLADEWERADGSAPAVDTSWVTTENGELDSEWGLVATVAGLAVLCVIVLVMAGAGVFW